MRRPLSKRTRLMLRKAKTAATEKYGTTSVKKERRVPKPVTLAKVQLRGDA